MMGTSALKENTPPTIGERAADVCVRILGSWWLVIILTMFFGVWMWWNYGTNGFDPYPYILLNLMLSFLAAYGNPVLIMASRRLERLDRDIAYGNYELSLKSDEMLKDIIDELHRITTSQKMLLEILGLPDEKSK